VGKKKNEDLQKHTLNLREGDWDYLERVFSERGYPVSSIVRNVISHYVDRLKVREKTEAPEIDLENLNVD